jgi:phosphate-selective porin OprO/OprP
VLIGHTGSQTKMKKTNCKLNRWLLAAILGVPTALSAIASEEDDIAALKAQAQDLDQKIQILERERELDQEDATNAATAAKTLPQISVGANGFSFVNFGSKSDTNFAVAIHGVLQMDTRTFGNDDKVPGSSGFLLRRARPILSGTVFRDFDFLFVPDFGNAAPGNTSATPTPTIYDAFVNYHYSPELQFQAGKFKTPIGLEQLQADANILFNERSLVTDLVPNRDLGFALHGDIAGGVLSYAAGVFNGVGDERNTSNYSFQDNREFDGRLFAEPFKKTGQPWLKNLGVGVAGGWGQSSITNTLGLPNTTGGSLGGYTTDGQQQFFAYNPASGAVVAGGTHWRLSPQGTYYYGPFGLMGEYAISDQGVKTSGATPVRSADLQNTAWEITGSWVVTGEDASFNGVTPLHPFDPRAGHWGAFQVVGRYAELNIDQAAFPYFSNPKTSASGAQAWGVGLNWYLNQNIRADASFSRTTFEGEGITAASPPGSVSSHPEDVFFTRLQLAF